MKRSIEDYLLHWKEKKDCFPLLVRGARQVGKSFIIEDFGKKYFKNIAIINFEFNPFLKECFSDLDPQQIIKKLQLLLNIPITPGNTLLFLDEIQECPNAILALRYFKEKMPDLSVIGAGSLLEFAFRNKDFRFPVGRIQLLNLEPLSFYEFLDATRNTQLKIYLSGLSPTSLIDKVIHNKLLELIRIYFVIGGMPAVVKEYIETGNVLECQHLQASLLETFRNDFGKYANLTHHKYLQKVFDSAPQLAGQRIKYVNIDSETKSRDLKNALELLTIAKIVRPVYAAKASGLPLGAQINPQKFKLNLLDIGLMQHACGLQGTIQLEKDIMQINSGALTEQFTGQELRACADPYQNNPLYFWVRDKRGSMAEVDYLLAESGYILPVEVKSGKTGTLKSLKIFMDEKKSSFGIRIWAGNLYFNNNILSVPLYMIPEISRLIKNIIC